MVEPSRKTLLVFISIRSTKLVRTTGNRIHRKKREKNYFVKMFFFFNFLFLLNFRQFEKHDHRTGDGGKMRGDVFLLMCLRFPVKNVYSICVLQKEPNNLEFIQRVTLQTLGNTINFPLCLFYLWKTRENLRLFYRKE